MYKIIFLNDEYLVINMTTKQTIAVFSTYGAANSFIKNTP